MRVRPLRSTGARIAATVVPVPALLVTTLVLAGCGDDGKTDRADDGPPPARSARTIQELRPERVLARVEALRGLKVKKAPTFVVRTPNEARKDVEKAQDREAGGKESKREERTNLQLVTLLGLLPKGIDLDELAGRITSQGTLGYYDGDKNEMTIISKGPRLPIGVETTVAHELTHAIDEEHFGVFEKVVEDKGDDDAQTAYQAVVEGNATDVEERYRKKYRIPQPDPAGDAEQQKLLRDLPFGIQLQLGFPYALGQVFIEAIRGRGGDALVAKALGRRPPRSTVEILDPSRYLERTPVVKTPLRPASALGPRWTELDRDSIGAADVLALLSATEDDAAIAAPIAQKWTGGSYRFLRRGGAAENGCGVPCVSRDAVVGSVAFGAPDDAEAFEEAFGSLLEKRRGAKSAGDRRWTVAGGGAAAREDGYVVTFAYAPTPGLAGRLVTDAPQTPKP
ncbi:hypothetical protein [Patulibacter minatonensis]|uniref:hypothetical protein n=1 Tax=Patulibacter minatonensis TaxID=298163 RepID=UPI00047D182A|nr:hypothetical protein [Patulibacter minatonensis]